MRAVAGTCSFAAALLFWTGLALGAPALQAQDPPLLIQRALSPIEFDGQVDEEAWLSIPPLPAVMSSPNFGAEPSEGSEFRVTYDDDYLYVSGVLHDSDSDGIRATSLRRDDGSLSNDWFAVTIDGYLDRENGLLFGVTAGGARADVAFANDAQSGPNFAWNAFWDAEVVRTETGWSAEMRIPFTTIPYQPDENGRVVMGLTIWRHIARKNERIAWPPIEPIWAQATSKASLTAPVELHGLSLRRALHVTPYLLAGGSSIPALAPGGSEWVREESGVRETGVDVKVGVTANLTMDLTLNTDFAQVEADDQEVNLTRFSLFFPERRLFFQERAGIFSFDTGDSDRLFYSRRIGLVNGQPARIYGGARIVGRIGEWDVGMLNMHTDAGAEENQNVGTLRLRRRLHNASSYGGGMLTTLIGEDGRYNVAGGLDLLLHLSGQHFLTLNWAQSWSDDDESGLGLTDRGLARVQFERRGRDGLSLDLAASRVGEQYDPQLGYLRRRDFTRLGDGVGWGWRASPASRILRTTLDLNALAFFRNEGFVLESLDVGPSFGLEMKTGSRVNASFKIREEQVPSAFGISGAVVSAGDYRWTEGRFSVSRPAGALLRGSVSVEGGEFYDGSRMGFSVSPTWSQSRYLELNGLYQVTRLSFPDRTEGRVSTTIQVSRLRARVSMTHALSTQFFAQYSSGSDHITLNARLRYNRREGQDLYLVFNDGVNTDRLAIEPELPFSSGRTFLIKYSHALSFGW